MGLNEEARKALQIDEHVSRYWKGNVSRVEVQKIFNEYAEQLNRCTTALTALDAALAFLMEKLSIAPEEVNAWLKTQAEKAEAAAAMERAEEEAVSMVPSTLAGPDPTAN